MVVDESKNEELIVIGNGFDMRCDLKSSYKDFYEQRYTADFIGKITRYIEHDNEDCGKITIWDMILAHPKIENVRSGDWKDVEVITSSFLYGQVKSCGYLRAEICKAKGLFEVRSILSAVVFCVLIFSAGAFRWAHFCAHLEVGN